jgi:hypothetical protein
LDNKRKKPVNLLEKQKRDTQSRKYLITINNPVEHGFTHEKIKRVLMEFNGIHYYCMADEKGENETHHTHLYAVFNSPVRFSTIRNRFDNKAHIDTALGSSQENRDYITKEGKWLNDDKHGTKIEGTFNEWGEMPQERQGARTDLEYLYEKIKDGLTNYEILEDSPDFMLRISDIERTRKTIKEEENRNVFRILEVTYIWGATGTGKTRGVMEKYGYDNVYRITDYKHPFDAYKNNDCIVFDEFNSHLRIQDMNNYLDGYPLDLPCRYANKQACYTKVYIISNIDLKKQYMNVQYNEPEVWAAFLRRVHKIIQYMPDGTRREYTTTDYLSGTGQWIEIPTDTPIPRDFILPSVELFDYTKECIIPKEGDE